ncbi:histidine kinase [Bacillus kexueae]|uniref:histidine kinase n=1 Tax=Aeribacillus kexueae TaxID=2078952 RepID=UPI001FAE76BB
MYFSYHILQNQFIGIFVLKDTNGNFVIQDVEKGAYGDRKGLKVGDIVLEVNNEDPEKHKTIIYLRKLEQLSSLKVQKPDGSVHFYEIKTEFDVQIVFHYLVPLSLLLFAVFCCYYIYKSTNNAQSKSSIILIIFLLNISLAHLSAGASSRGDLLSKYLNVVFFIGTPVIYLHYIYTYFNEIGTIWFSKYYIKFSYFIVFLNAISAFLIYQVFTDQEAQINIMVFHLLSFLFLFLLTYTFIGIGIRKVRYKAQKYMIRIIIISNVLAFAPFLLFYVIPYSFFRISFFSPAYLVAFLLIIPFSLVYQFLATKVYDIEFLLGRFRYYALLSIVPAIFGVIIAITNRDIGPTEFTIRTYVFLFLLLFITFNVKELLDNKFQLKRFSEKYNYKDSLFKFTNKLRDANSLTEVIDGLKQEITDVLLVSSVSFITVDRNFEPVKVDQLHYTDVIERYRREIAEACEDTGKIVEVDKGFVLNIGESVGEYYILICLSKMNTPRLTVDEKSWLNALAYYTNVTLSNFLKIESLMSHLEQLKQEGKSPVWYNRVIYSLEEKQRSMLARDLHDSVLQDLISIKQKCEVSLQHDEDCPKTLQEQMKEIHEGLNNAILMTRETCNELRPQVLYDLGLQKALEKLASQYETLGAFHVQVNTSRLKIPNNLDLQLSLYRIVQELFANARKHSEAKTIKLMLISIKEKIVLHYEDDGVGADQNSLFIRDNSMGLSGIRERVKTLNGSMEIQTKPGEGFSVVIEI